jgi:hypothetical protein
LIAPLELSKALDAAYAPPPRATKTAIVARDVGVGRLITQTMQRRPA